MSRPSHALALFALAACGLEHRRLPGPAQTVAGAPKGVRDAAVLAQGEVVVNREMRSERGSETQGQMQGGLRGELRGEMHGKQLRGTAHSQRLRSKLAALRWMVKCGDRAAGSAGGSAAFRESLKSALGRTTPEYPFEPLLDVDYILNADRYLEDYDNAHDIPERLAQRYTTPPAAAATPASTTAPAPVTTAPTAGCVTRLDPRVERRLQFLRRSKPALEGTPCIFGLSPADEGSHCVQDGGRFGSFGWCYTSEDRSEWGSCSEGCPLEGSTEVLAARIDRLTSRVRDALANIGASQCLANASADSINGVPATVTATL